MGYIGTTLNGVTNAANAVETCRKYGDGSTLCHETGVGDAAYFGASEVAGAFAEKTALRWGVCNAALDLETAGSGVLICTITVAGASAVAGTVGGDFVKTGSEFIYHGVTIYSKRHNIFNTGN